MNIIPEHLSVKITDEVICLPFTAFGLQFELSAFQLESSGKIYECMCLHRGGLLKGDKNGVPVRIHSSCLTSETFGSPKCDCAWQLKHALNYIADSNNGMLIYLPWQEGRGNGLFQKIKTFPLMSAGMNTSEAFSALCLPSDDRDYTPAVAILHRFGLTRIQLITNNPDKIDAVQTSGIEIVRRIPSIMETDDPYLLNYLKSKALQHGNLMYGGCNEKLCRSTHISNI